MHLVIKNLVPWNMTLIEAKVLQSNTGRGVHRSVRFDRIHYRFDLLDFGF